MYLLTWHDASSVLERLLNYIFMFPRFFFFFHCRTFGRSCSLPCLLQLHGFPSTCRGSWTLSSFVSGHCLPYWRSALSVFPPSNDGPFYLHQRRSRAGLTQKSHIVPLFPLPSHTLTPHRRRGFLWKRWAVDLSPVTSTCCKRWEFVQGGKYVKYRQGVGADFMMPKACLNLFRWGSFLINFLRSGWKRLLCKLNEQRSHQLLLHYF